MRIPDTDRLERLTEALVVAFYVLLGVALLCVLVGSPGSGFLFLVLGAGAHVGRQGLEDFVDQT